MTQSEVEKILIDVVSAIQTISGRAAVTVGSATKPCGDMHDFDSLNGVEATIDVLGRLNLDVDFNNVLVENGEALSISQAATRLLKCMENK